LAGPIVNDFVADHFRKSCDTLQQAANDPALRETIYKISGAITRAFRAGNKLYLAGNGGSAADAQHIAAEFVSRLFFDRNPLPAVAFTTDTSAITAIGNDYGFDKIFERQVRGIARQGDVFIAISTSGKSPNILAALAAARDMGVLTVGFTGSREAPMAALCDLCLAAPSPDTALIQQIHIVAAHVICGLVERDIFGPKSVG